MPDPDDFDYSAIADQCRRHRRLRDLPARALATSSMATACCGAWSRRWSISSSDEPAGLLLADRRLAIQAEVARRTLEAAKGRDRHSLAGRGPGHPGPPHDQPGDLPAAYPAALPETGRPGQGVQRALMIHTCGSSSWAYEDFIEMGDQRRGHAAAGGEEHVAGLPEEDLRRTAGVPRVHQHGRPRGVRHAPPDVVTNCRRDAGYHDAGRRLLLCPDPLPAGQLSHGKRRRHVRDGAQVRGLLTAVYGGSCSGHHAVNPAKTSAHVGIDKTYI